MRAVIAACFVLAATASSASAQARPTYIVPSGQDGPFLSILSRTGSTCDHVTEIGEFRSDEATALPPLGREMAERGYGFAYIVCANGVRGVLALGSGEQLGMEPFFGFFPLDLPTAPRAASERPAPSPKG